MTKRSLLFGATGVGLALILSGVVSANWLLRIGGITIEPGSIISTVRIEKIQGLSDDPFRIIKYTLLDVTADCSNPAGMVSTGLAFHGPPKKIQGASAFVLDEDPFSDKQADTATSVDEVDPTLLFTSREACPNKNWTLLNIDVWKLSFEDSIIRCIKKGKNPCAGQQVVDVLTGTCTLSSGDTEYSCFIESHVHNDYHGQ